MSQTSLVFANEKHAKTQPRSLVFRLAITGAKAVSAVPVGADCLPAFDALSQAAIDAYLGTASEFLAAGLDATALGANDMAVLVKMSGQAAKVCGAEVQLYAASGALTTTVNLAAVAALTASTPANECAVGASGNIALKIKDLDAGLDALTSGYIVLTIHWVAK